MGSIVDYLIGTDTYKELRDGLNTDVAPPVRAFVATAYLAGVKAFPRALQLIQLYHAVTHPEDARQAFNNIFLLEAMHGATHASSRWLVRKDSEGLHQKIQKQLSAPDLSGD